jgi:hypothetical protein
MSDKPHASLSPTLLARKGGAKPAMRSQLHYPDSLARQVTEDDLGWNDMGDEAEAEVAVAAPVIQPAGEVISITAAASHSGEPDKAFVVESTVLAQKPAVLRQQEAIAQRVIAPAAPIDPKPRRSALDDGRRAAFTLRVDAERHLKLRLACTIRNRSAQQLVTEALDRLIDELPDLATLAAQVAKQR